MKNLLKQTFLNHTQKVSDKWTLYINEWDRIFYPYRDDSINLFEIGVQNGGSLEIWAKYFKNANKIVGCDIDEKCRELSFADPRIELLVGDANTDEIQEKALEKAPKYDIIIDDGSHKSSDVIRSFSRYFPYLKDNGIYIVEDLHTSYWQDFGGGLFDPTSSISFFKRLADIVNAEHWRNNQSRESYLSKFADNLQISFSENDLIRIHSIDFLNSMCILKKRRPEENVLGKRVVVGTEELVTEGWEKLDGTSVHDFAVAIKDDSDLDVFELVKRLESANQSIGKLNLNLGEKDQTIVDLGKDLAEEKQIAEKLTKDLAEQNLIIQKLTADLAEREQTVEKLTADLAEREQTVEKLMADLTERETTVGKLTTDLTERETTVGKLTADLAEREQAIEKLEKTVLTEQPNTKLRIQDLEKKINGLIWEIAQKDNAYAAEKKALSEENHRLEQENVLLGDQKAELEKALAFAKKEIVDYYTSTSWKITRPFRWLTKQLRGRNA